MLNKYQDRADVNLFKNTKREQMKPIKKRKHAKKINIRHVGKKDKVEVQEPVDQGAQHKR